MPTVSHLIARDDDNHNDSTSTVLKLLIALMVIFGFITLLIIAIFIIIPFIRRRKQAKAAEDINNKQFKHLSIHTSNYVIQEKKALIEETSAPPSPSSVPEIRITFPEEVDNKTGRPQSGRVVVVRMGENAAIGLEPLNEELPPYQKEQSDYFSLDLEKMGGLKEKI